MKKILFVITKSNFGGAQRYVFDLATTLPRDQFEVSVALGGTGAKGAQVGELERKLNEAGVPTTFMRSFARDIHAMYDVKMFLELYMLYRKERPDIVHLNSSKAAGLGAFAARCAGVPRVVVTIHGWAFNEPRPGWQRVIIKALQWLTVLFSHRTIVVSRADFIQSMRWPLVHQKISCIHNGIPAFSLREKEPAREALCSFNPDLRKHLQGTWIGTNSELHPNKGLDILLRAFARARDGFPDTICVLMSSGDERTRLEELARELSIGRDVFFLGFVPDGRAYLKAFDIFSMPSRKEGLPYAILEAGRAALPVIASRVGGIPEILANPEEGILVPKDDAEALSDSLSKLLADKVRRRSLGESLERRIRSEFSLGKMAEQTAHVYLS